MAYWLMKSEPSVYPFEQLAKDKTTGWDSVRNFVARNHMKAMKVGDEAFFYHSNADPPCIVGTMRIVKEAHADPLQFDEDSEYYEPRARPEKPYWYMVEVGYGKPFKQPVVREQLKQEPRLAGMEIFQHARLSVTPVTPEEWGIICEMGGL